MISGLEWGVVGMVKCGKARRTAGVFLAWFFVLFGTVFSAAGCSVPDWVYGAEDESEDVLVLKKDQDEGSAYTLTEVIVTDFEKTASMRFDYTQARSEDVFFPVSGKRVEEVYVNLGDRVEEGQLLAILEGGNHAEEIRELEYQIARAKIQYGYLDENEEYELSGRYWRFSYQSSGSEEEEEKLQSDLENIRQKYQYKREDYQDIIDMAAMRIASYQKEMEEGCIYAGMSGIVHKFGGNMDTIVSDVSKPAFTIIDDSRCLFEASGAAEYADAFAEGEIYELAVGRDRRVYQVRPWGRETWGDKIYLELLEGDGTDNIEFGTYAYLTLTLEKRENVLAVNRKAVHTANGRSYVYVLGENDIREVKWVETGLTGDKLTEIVSGLKEGEAVILK